MRVLILGGTVFLGRAVAEAALKRGDEVTLLNRGKSNPDLFPQAEKLSGDRNDVAFMNSVLRGRQWDVVVDTSGYIPRQIRTVMEALAGGVEHYTFVSSVSVYSDYSQHPIAENGPLSQMAEESDEVTGPTYGAQKARCETAAESAMPGRVLNVRPGLIVGPHDNIGRFPYWVRRVAQGGEVLAPGKPERQVQLIDVRDLAEWILRMDEGRKGGTFNATGPDYRLTMSAMLNACKEATNSNATFTWASDDFLEKEQIGGWEQMPFWLPASQNADGILDVDVSKAIAAGLTFRPLVQTTRDTYEWIKVVGDNIPTDDRGFTGRAGLEAEKEAELLSKWKQLA